MLFAEHLHPHTAHDAFPWFLDLAEWTLALLFFVVYIASVAQWYKSQHIPRLGCLGVMLTLFTVGAIQQFRLVDAGWDTWCESFLDLLTHLGIIHSYDWTPDYGVVRSLAYVSLVASYAVLIRALICYWPAFKTAWVKRQW
jgi:hypothetical protein